MNNYGYDPRNLEKWEEEYGEEAPWTPLSILFAIIGVVLFVGVLAALFGGLMNLITVGVVLTVIFVVYAAWMGLTGR